MRAIRRGAGLLALLFVLGVGQLAHAASAAELDRKAGAALRKLVFPNIVKGGFVFGGQFGDAFLMNDKITRIHPE